MSSQTPEHTNIQSFDPFENGWKAISNETFAALRKNSPVIQAPSGLWFLTRYDDCRRVLVEKETFSNAAGLRAAGVKVPPEDRMINEMDGAAHARLRKLEQATLRQGNFRDAVPLIQQLANDICERLPRNTPVDLVPLLTSPLPSKVASHLMGIPPEDHESFQRWSREVCGGDFVAYNQNSRGVGLDGAHPEFAAYIDSLAEERRATENQADDLITRLTRTEVDGDRLSSREIRIAIAHLIIAGNETTTQLLGNLIYRLLEYPDRYQRLRQDRSLVPKTVEESLRYDAVVQVLARTCVRDTEVRGKRIDAGARVVLGIASANRDEEAFGADAAEFRVDRDPKTQHLGFGFGAHYCLGANLARLEAMAVLNSMLDRFSGAGLASGFQYERLPGGWELGPQRMEVCFDE